jgi:hypothetical protein
MPKVGTMLETSHTGPTFVTVWRLHIYDVLMEVLRYRVFLYLLKVVLYIGTVLFMGILRLVIHPLATTKSKKDIEKLISLFSKWGLNKSSISRQLHIRFFDCTGILACMGLYANFVLTLA